MIEFFKRILLFRIAFNIETTLLSFSHLLAVSSYTICILFNRLSLQQDIPFPISVFAKYSRVESHKSIYMALCLWISLRSSLVFFFRISSSSYYFFNERLLPKNFSSLVFPMKSLWAAYTIKLCSDMGNNIIPNTITNTSVTPPRSPMRSRIS